MDTTNELSKAVSKQETITEATIRFKQMEDINMVNFWLQGKMLYVLRREGVDLRAYVPANFKTSYARCMEYLRLVDDYLEKNEERKQLILEAEEAPLELMSLGPDKLLELVQIRRENRDEFLKSLPVAAEETSVREFREEKQKFLEENPEALSERVKKFQETRANYRRDKLFSQLDDTLYELEPVIEAISHEFLKEFQQYSRYRRVKRVADEINALFLTPVLDSEEWRKGEKG